MKPRILKKLSKKALAIFAASPRRDFQMDTARAWIEHEFEGDYISVAERQKSAKGEREHRNSQVSVNHVPCIGGEFDSYSGDASEIYTLFRWAENYVLMDSIDWDSLPEDEFGFPVGWPSTSIKGRLTGKKVIERLRAAASEVDA